MSNLNRLIIVWSAMLGCVLPDCCDEEQSWEHLRNPRDEMKDEVSLPS